MTELYMDELASTLSHIDYNFVRQYPSLKGLLKPFKGKGEYEALLIEVEASITRLELIATRLIDDTKNKLPVKYLPFNLNKRKLKNGSVYLTWRQCKTVTEDGNKKRIVSVEGKQLVLLALSDESNLSNSEKEFLKEIEQDRLSLNFQMRTCAMLRYLITEMLPKLDELTNI